MPLVGRRYKCFISLFCAALHVCNYLVYQTIVGCSLVHIRKYILFPQKVQQTTRLFLALQWYISVCRLGWFECVIIGLVPRLLIFVSLKRPLNLSTTFITVPLSSFVICMSVWVCLYWYIEAALDSLKNSILQCGSYLIYNLFLWCWFSSYFVKCYLSQRFCIDGSYEWFWMEPIDAINSDFVFALLLVEISVFIKPLTLLLSL